MDLDDEELEATRKLNGTVKKSNIEEDIKILEKFNPGDEYTEKIKTAIEHILAERKQNKTRIQELEEENKKYIVQLTDKEYRNLVDIIRKEAKQEFEQKVKDKIEEIKEDKESKYFDTFLMARDINYAIDILKELLEDK